MNWEEYEDYIIDETTFHLQPYEYFKRTGEIKTNKRGEPKFNKEFLAYLSLTRGFNGSTDILKPIGKAYNPLTKRVVSRNTVFTSKGVLRKRFRLNLVDVSEMVAEEQTEEDDLVGQQQPPRLIEVGNFGGFNGFTQTRYITENTVSLQDFYNLIRQAVSGNEYFPFLRLYFRSLVSGGYEYRSCREINMETFDAFSKFLEDVFRSEEKEYGMEATEYRLDMSIFDLTFTRVLGYGGNSLLYESLGTRDGKCWWDTLNFIQGIPLNYQPEKCYCPKCKKLCIISWRVDDGGAFWSCNEPKCRRLKDLRAYSSFQYEMTPEDSLWAFNGNPKYSNYPDFVARLSEIDKDVQIIFNSYTLEMHCETSCGLKRFQEEAQCERTNQLSAVIRQSGRLKKVPVLSKEKFYKMRGYEHDVFGIKYAESEDTKNLTDDSIAVIFDATNKHYDIVLGLPIFRDDLYISASNVICNKTESGMKPIATPTNMTTNNIGAVSKKRLLFWDVETVIDFYHKNVMKPYSVSFCSLSPEELGALALSDAKGKIGYDVKSMLDSRTKCFIGYDCLIRFIEWVISQEDVIFDLISFNGSRFDHFLLLDTLLSSNNHFKIRGSNGAIILDAELSVSNIFFNKNSCMNFTIQNRHKMFDMARHLVGSLSDNCKGFKVNCLGKSTFDHDQAQDLYDQGELINFMTGNNELIDYNNRDVWSLAIIYFRYCQALSAIPETKKMSENLTNCMTIGSMSWSLMKRHIADMRINGVGIKLPRLEMSDYNAILRYKTAGRVQLFNGVQEVNEPIVSKDITSMYPYHMCVAPNYFPCGEIVPTETYREDKIGFYWCDIDQSVLKVKNLPYIVAEKVFGPSGGLIENNWDCPVINNYCLNSITIQHCIDNGCDVRIHNGFYFTDKIRGCDLFRPLLGIMKTKTEQDRLKARGDDAYNPALRETTKLCLNSVSGKIIEGLHTEVVEQLSVERYCSIMKDIIDNNGKYSSINTINLVGDRVFADLTVKPEELLKKQRPVYLGILVYAYSQRYIYETGFKPIGLKDLIYCDTDSYKCRASVFEREDVKQFYKEARVFAWPILPNYDENFGSVDDNNESSHPLMSAKSKVFGSYDEELSHNDYSCFLQKKAYIIINTSTNKAHIGFKGVPPKSIIVDKESEYLERKIIHHHDGTETEKYKISSIPLALKALRDTSKQICNNALTFSKTLYETRKCLVLTKAFRKTVSNTKSCSDPRDNERVNQLLFKIQVCPILKEIVI